MKILQIKTSILSQYSTSNQLSNEFVDQYMTKHSAAKLEILDFETTAIPHLDSKLLSALSTDQSERSNEQVKQVAFADSLIEQLQDSDVIVLGLPMYNFNVPSMLSSYFDHVARAGVTFNYTATGPVGLLKNKKVYVMATRGGIHRDLPSDTQTGYLTQIFGFLGITDVEFIYAEGLNMDDSIKEQGLKQARAAITTTVAG
ncbi:MAG: NAD(P)H-dependent oxidoreductase [Gammaproteobacteria bacterium]|nr:NAD(P)H-dependent oxidoreductase [Gammaproteobacteria bacterium]